MRYYVSVSNGNVFSRFLKVARECQLTAGRVDERIPHDGTMNGETTVAVTCPRAWNDELASVGGSQMTTTSIE